ncbi:hypothetical protein P9112_012721 [Eukaryota sp. TZLM1-RC]
MRLSTLLIAGCTFIITTLTICVIGAKMVFTEYQGRLIYLSASGARFPIYPLFAFALTVAGVFLTFIIISYLSIVEKTHNFKQHVIRQIRLLAIVAGPSLAATGCISTNDATIWHGSAAGLFFTAAVITVLLITVNTYRSKKIVRTCKFWMFYRIAVLSILCIAFFAYVIGPMIGTEAGRNISIIGQYVSTLTVISFFYSLRLEFGTRKLTISEDEESEGLVL